ncbi:MAG TPA: hypothetical protein VG841_02815 [Caulobacterales bacterium]|nr:hypothetical protein [Caulobacterales bacterium]
MRMVLAAAAALSIWAASAAAAPWTSPDSKISFDLPAGWLVAPQDADDMTYIVAGSGDKECDFMARPRAQTAAIPPDVIRESGKLAVAPADWARLIPLAPDVFGGQASFVSSEVSTDAFWPVQLADFRVQGRIVHAAIQFRPGVDLWAFCQSRSGADDVATYRAVLRSVGAPNDAALQADAERLAAQRQSVAQNQNAP